MGHYDLTVSLGIPAQFRHPEFLKAMDRFLASCQRNLVTEGFLPANPQDALHWIAKGFRAISLGADVYLYSQAVRTFHDSVVEGLPSMQAA